MAGWRESTISQFLGAVAAPFCSTVPVGKCFRWKCGDVKSQTNQWFVQVITDVDDIHHDDDPTNKDRKVFYTNHESSPREPLPGIFFPSHFSSTWYYSLPDNDGCIFHADWGYVMLRHVCLVLSFTEQLKSMSYHTMRSLGTVVLLLCAATEGCGGLRTTFFSPQRRRDAVSKFCQVA